MSNISQFIGGDPQYWVSGTTYALGKTVRSPTDHQRYVRVVAGAGTTDPANDATNWRPDGGRAIKSVQRGSISVSSGANPTGSVAIAISAVNTSKTEVRFLGGSGYSDSSLAITQLAQLALTNSTTLTASASRGAAGFEVRVSWELTEYY